MAISFDVFAHNLMHRWQERQLESGWRFNQMLDPTPYGDGIRSPSVYYQHHREVIAHALTSAFKQATRMLGYYPQPTYSEDVIIPIKRRKIWNKDTFNIGKPYAIDFGKEDLGISVEYTLGTSPTFDSNGIPDTDLITFTVNEGQTFSHFQNLKILINTGSDDRNRRRLFNIPIDFSRGRLLIIKFWNMVDVNQLKKIYVDGQLYIIDRSDDNNFHNREDLSLYDTAPNPDEAVKVLSTDRSNQDLEIQETIVKAEFTNKRLGDFVLAKDEEDPPGEPFAIKASFLSGFPWGTNFHMESLLEDAVLQLSMTHITMQNLPYSHLAYASWQDSNVSISDTEGRIAPEDHNPLGNKRGHSRAWKIIEEFADGLTGRAKAWRGI